MPKGRQLIVSGESEAYSEDTITADYEMTADDGFTNIFSQDFMANITVTLPPLDESAGRKIELTKASNAGPGSSLTIEPGGSDSFLSGVASVILTGKGDTTVVRGTTLGWILL